MQSICGNRRGEMPKGDYESKETFVQRPSLCDLSVQASVLVEAQSPRPE